MNVPSKEVIKARSAEVTASENVGWTPGGDRLRPRVGLALSSGGARGLAHVGVIQVLEENGIAIDVIAGASMGAYVGALWAAGYSGRELQEFAAEIRSPRDLWGRLDLALPPVRGLFHGRMIKERLAAALKGASFADLLRELHVVAANLDTYERRVFSSGDVATAVHASSAVPGVCVPVEVEGCRYVDGGIVDPVPVGVLADLNCDRIIGVSVIPTFEDIARGAAPDPETPPVRPFRSRLKRLNRSFNVFADGNVVDTLRRSVLSAQIRLAHHSRHRADVLLRPQIVSTRWHDYHNYLHYIEMGRKAALAQLPALLALADRTLSKGGSNEIPNQRTLVSNA
ncbi:MAG: patatin-like phospholipase family protein [Verrucomicrobiales bacterium]